MSKGSLRASIISIASADGTQKLLINQTNPNANLPNMKSSLALLARRAAVVASRRGVASPAVATTFVRAAFSTQAAHDFESNMDIIDDVNHLNDPKVASQFAVESPDGDYDGHLAEELAEVKRLIDAQAASAEDASAILRDRAAVAKTLAVDAPDGEDDAHFSEEMLEIAKIIDAQAASAEDASAILADRAAAAKVMAVESPDGEVDGHILEELEEVNHIIDKAAKYEDKEAVEKRHDWDKKERIEAEKHPEHDW